MYSTDSLYGFTGWVIIVLVILSAIALVVCLADRARWKRAMRPYPGTYVVEYWMNDTWNRGAYVIGYESATFTLGQVRTALPSLDWRIREVE